MREKSGPRASETNALKGSVGLDAIAKGIERVQEKEEEEEEEVGAKG